MVDQNEKKPKTESTQFSREAVLWDTRDSAIIETITNMKKIKKDEGS